MNKAAHYFTQSLPFIGSKWQTVLFPTLWVFLLCVILEPFGFHRFSYKPWTAMVYAGIAAISCSVVIYGFPLLFKTYYSSNNFTIGKFFQACFSIIIIATIFSCAITHYMLLLDNLPIRYSTIERFGIWFLVISFIALFPIMVVFMLLRNTKLKMIRQELENNYRFDASSLINDENAIVLGKNSKAPLSIPLDKLLYVEALGNYVVAYYVVNDSIKQRQFRETLVQIMDELKDYQQIVRCHRSFVVNTENVILPKNTQSNQLWVKVNNTKIPISRSYVKEVRRKLEAV